MPGALELMDDLLPGSEQHRAIASYCPQNATNDLPPGTVAEVIAGGCPGATEEQLAAAYSLANLGVAPAVLWTQDAALLSGGQQQRVAHARGYLKVMAGGAKLLVLDEPTSALDASLSVPFGLIWRGWSNRRAVVCWR